MMQRISSNATLALKIFIPTIWVVFFGAFTLAFLIGKMYATPTLDNWFLRLVWSAGFLTIWLLIRFTLWKLCRIDIDADFLYVSDYFKTARYPKHNIESISSQSYGLFRLGVVRYQVPGVFGKKSIFLENKGRITELWRALPEWTEKWKSGDDPIE
jgi:hypothetical protein